MRTHEWSRRRFARGVVLAGGAALVACEPSRSAAPPEYPEITGGKTREGRAEHEGEPLITPGEDLMREHGVLERVLVVWAESEAPLREGRQVDVSALSDSVELVKRFIEGYHERLEEELLFPRLAEAGRERALVRTLEEQHEVGHGITAELRTLLDRPLDAASRARIAERMASYARMYAAHASREDTIVFPAFREIAGARYAELGEQFERLEHEILGEGGFDQAVAEVSRIERALGLHELARYTPERSRT